nr:hypothetical protein [Trentepohlia sp. YN1317]
MHDRLLEYVSTISHNHSVQTLQKIFTTSFKDPNRIFKDLYSLLCDINILLLAYANISNNKGSSTPGTTFETIDGMTLQRIEQIQQELKNKTYQFSPFRRIMIDKPSKPGDNKNTPKKQRPLGIPEWKDRIVQEALRLVLNAIYEPLFYMEGNNYGFRPKLSCQHAIEYIKINCHAMSHVIEGDIKGAYDNVDFKILINLLRKKISDHNLINLIKNSLNCGLEFNNHYQDTIVGVPQGSIVSPLFFNIYMHEFDKYIINKIKPKTQPKRLKYYVELHNNYINPQRMKLEHKKQTAYRQIKRQFPKKTQYELLKSKKKEQSLDRQTKLLKWQQIRKNIKTIRHQLHKTPYIDYKKTQKRSVFVRYADDWVLFSNHNVSALNDIKERCKSFLKDHLKLELSEEKTRITDLKRHEAKFLGFNIAMYTEKITTVKIFDKS